MEKGEKREFIEKLREELKDVDSIFLCDFKGLTVESDTQLRKQMRESGATYKVIKNTILKLAFKDTDFSQLDTVLVGNTAIAYNPENVVGLSKLIFDFNKENEKFVFKQGVVQGQLVELAQLEKLAKMPSKEVLVSKLMYMMNYPIQGFATALAGVIRNFAVVVDQIKKQKEQ